ATHPTPTHASGSRRTTRGARPTRCAGPSRFSPRTSVDTTAANTCTVSSISQPVTRKDSMNKLRAEDLAFLERAPKRWDFEEPVAATPEAVFEAISADPSTWSWFPGLSKDARYHGPGPHGVGSIREVSMAGKIGRASCREGV